MGMHSQKLFSLLLLSNLFLINCFGQILINPTYTDAVGETWSADRIAVFEQAITDWTSSISYDTSVTVDVNVTFTREGTDAYMGQWAGSNSGAAAGSDIYSWSSSVTNEIRFNADLFSFESNGYTLNANWSLDTPGSLEYDMLSIARHEICHMLGFANGFFMDNYGSSSTDRWNTLITDTTFDLGGLDVSLESSDDLSHVLNSGATEDDLMVTALVNGQRREISDTDISMLVLAHGYTAVPEPATYALLFSLCLLLYTRRKK